MARDKNQTMVYSQKELELIKQTFAENDALLYTIRKVFLQFPLTPAEKELIRLQVTESVYNILKKRILPDLDPDSPLTQIASILTTLTNDLKAKDVEEMALQFEAKQLEVDYLEQQFAVLKDLEATQEIRLNEMSHIKRNKYEMPTNDPRDNFINMTAYLFLLGYIDPMLNFIKSIAGQKEETPAQQLERLTRDSSK